ncbi:MAG: tRNA preQ1(34) S-adenosylmethionine ribosyltransferase-isomerase QueA [Acidobacteriota bacterium]
MRLADFDYDLPSDLVAQHPTSTRDTSRLMVADRKTKKITHARFCDLPAFLAPGDLLVINNTRVFPARLFALREGGTSVLEVLLLKRVTDATWEVLIKPGRKARAGHRLSFGPKLTGSVLDSASPEQMTRLIQFHSDGDFFEQIQELGQMPLPPYIDREPGHESPEDRERYQTVYAERTGSVAAPTAGLHFTPALLERLRHVAITLHVGYGTFQPVKADQVEEHRMHSEDYEIGPEAALEIQSQLEQGRRIVAVGTTSTRVLEHVYRANGRIVCERGSTDIFIYPGFDFGVTGALITNFHLPKSTLLLLVSAFAGTEFIRECYREAIRQRYRFYSYGDAMLIL